MTVQDLHERKKPYTVCLLGASLDGGNLGVCALASALVGLIRQARPDARVLLLYGERRGGVRPVPLGGGAAARVRVLNYRLSPRARLGEHLLWIFLLALLWRLGPPLRRRLERGNLWLHALRQADFIGDIHAGDSFSDIYGLRRFAVGLLPDVIALLLGKRLVFLPQTYGPFASAPARAAARAVLRRAGRCYARDRESLAAIQRLLGQGGAPAASFCPDVAFALEPVKGGFVTIQPPLLPRAAAAPPLVGLNISGLLAIGGYSRDNMFELACDYNALIEGLIEALMRRSDAHLLIVSHVLDDSAESDLPAALKTWRRSFAKHERRLHLVTGRYGPAHIKQVIGLCDLFIGSRMHACIAALSQGIPALGIAYSLKFRGVFESAGVEDLVLDARRLGEAEIIDRCLGALRERERLAGQLARRLPELRRHLRACFAEELTSPAAPALDTAIPG
jgi:polysaccharide pyruvyl transferase WcaK-like protein